MRHAVSLLTLVAFVLFVAAYVPGNAIKARLEHPMVLSVKLWALAHLLANGTVADLLLFGGFLVWAIFDYRSVRRRSSDVAGEASAEGGVATDTARTTTRLSPTVATLVVAVVAWALFAFWVHGAWIGVRPFG